MFRPTPICRNAVAGDADRTPRDACGLIHEHFDGAARPVERVFAALLRIPPQASDRHRLAAAQGRGGLVEDRLDLGDPM
jgi:hypothetical protein